MAKYAGHTFHIPVLGIAFSVDAPIKVARYGISSVISLVDDSLMEKLRRHYLEKLGRKFIPVSEDSKTPRAQRITAYLDMVNEIVTAQFADLRSSSFTAGSEITKYFEMLPEFSELKMKYNEMMRVKDLMIKKEHEDRLRESIYPGSIDVNIMTKLDKSNYNSSGEQLPAEYNDAHAALRGYALSTLESSIIFSAGMNPKLYSYLETFNDFLPNSESVFKKKIVIKVSDFRSALIQGKFLAKKGLWVSEFRIESGLNCGGHAFATEGLLLGPILNEFKNRKDELLETLRSTFLPAINKKEIFMNSDKLFYDITVQGGVGRCSEQEFLIRHYGVKSVGWGSPFLLVPEVMNVDEYTLQKLSAAREEDFYLSNISPLGVPFNSLRGNSKDIEKLERIEKGKPGSACVKKFLLSSKEYSDKPLCTASISYINKKDAELKKVCASDDEYKNEYDKMVDKTCLCEGLAAPALIVNDIESYKQSRKVSVCPGPNLAYFSKIATLNEMVDHIYGKINLITHRNRPNMFIKELELYVDYLQKKAEESFKNFSKQAEEAIGTFTENLLEGIKYYKRTISEIKEETEKEKEKILNDLNELESKLLTYFMRLS